MLLRSMGREEQSFLCSDINVLFTEETQFLPAG